MPIVKFNPSSLEKPKTGPIIPSKPNAAGPTGPSILEMAHNTRTTLMFGLDTTASTSAIIGKFKDTANKVFDALSEQRQGYSMYFGYFNGYGYDLGLFNKDNPNILKTYTNRASSNDLSNYLIGALEEGKIDGKKIIVIFADGWEGDMQKERIKHLFDNNVYLFFLYDHNNGEGTANKSEIQSFINTLGSNAQLLDLNTNINLVGLISAIAGYVKQTHNTSTSGRHNTFLEYLTNTSPGLMKGINGPKLLGGG